MPQLGQGGGELRQDARLSVGGNIMAQFLAYAGAVWWSVAVAFFCAIALTLVLRLLPGRFAA